MTRLGIQKIGMSGRSRIQRRPSVTGGGSTFAFTFGGQPYTFGGQPFTFGAP
jgi:hypothetical protein